MTSRRTVRAATAPRPAPPLRDARHTRGLTLRQPWAWLVAVGHKRVENRTWSTVYRGPLVLHAAAQKTDTSPAAARADEHAPPAGSAHGAEHWTDPTGAPHPRGARGAVVALTRLLDVHPATADCCPDDPYAHRPTGEDPLHHWCLGETWCLPAPLATIGWVGLWIPKPDTLHALADLAVAPGSTAPGWVRAQARLWLAQTGPPPGSDPDHAVPADPPARHRRPAPCPT